MKNFPQPHQLPLIPLAEFEYLYDQDHSYEGQIDPNILSAGGFPTTFSWMINFLIEHILRLPRPMNCDAYIEQRLNGIALFVHYARTGRDIGPFSATLVKRYHHFLEEYVQVMLPDFVNEAAISDFKVSWEADLGYFCQYYVQLHAPNCQYTVWHDLHAKSGLFARGPLAVLGALWSKKTLAIVYQTLRLGEGIRVGSTFLVKRPGKLWPVLQCRGGQLKIDLSKDRRVIALDVFLAEEILTPVFNQYGYLYQLLPQACRGMETLSKRRALLSSLGNAKAALFAIYGLAEQARDNYLQRPPTRILTGNHIAKNDLQKLSYHSKVVIKEGSHFSAGGQEVKILDLSEQPETIRLPFATTVAQGFVPSLLFSIEGRPLHGHVRVLALLTAAGKRLTAGFVCKLTTSAVGNSSAFVTISLLFDLDGSFVAGQFSGTKPRFFTSLDEARLKPLLSKNEWLAFLNRAEANWDQSLAVLNVAFSSQLSLRVNSLVNQKLIAPWYYQSLSKGSL